MEVLSTSNEREVTSGLLHSLQVDNARLRLGLKELLRLFIQQHKDNLSRIKQLLKPRQKNGEVSYLDFSDPSTIQGRISRTLTPARTRTPAVPGRPYFDTGGAGDILLASNLIMDKVLDDHPQSANDTEASRTLPFNRNDIPLNHSKTLDKNRTSVLQSSQLVTKIVADDVSDSQRHRFNIFSPRLQKSFSLPLPEKNENKRVELTTKLTSNINSKYKNSRVARLASYLGKEGRRLSSNQLKKWLLSAAKTNDLQMAQFIISQGTDVNVREIGSHKTPLIIAAENNSTDVANLLISSGAYLELVDAEHSYTALSWAAWKNNLEMVKILLKAKSDTEATNKLGSTAMSIATDPEILKLLNYSKSEGLKTQKKGVVNIPSKRGKHSTFKKIKSRESGQFLFDNLREEELPSKVKHPAPRLSIVKEQIVKEQIPKSWMSEDATYSSRYLLEDSKETAVKEQAEYKTLVSENEWEKFGGIENATQQDDSKFQKQPMEKSVLAHIHVRSMSLGEIQDEDERRMGHLSENRSESSWDGY